MFLTVYLHVQRIMGNLHLVYVDAIEQHQAPFIKAVLLVMALGMLATLAGFFALAWPYNYLVAGGALLIVTGHAPLVMSMLQNYITSAEGAAADNEAPDDPGDAAAEEAPDGSRTQDTQAEFPNVLNIAQSLARPIAASLAAQEAVEQDKGISSSQDIGQGVNDSGEPANKGDAIRRRKKNKSKKRGRFTRAQDTFPSLCMTTRSVGGMVLFALGDDA